MIDGKRVGFFCSSFDLFHAGHVLALKEAKTQCDFLIVALQTDPTVDRPVIKNKPIQSLFERYVQIEGCKYVDLIVPYTTEKELLDILLSYHIDVRCMGEEYQGQKFTGSELDIPIYYNKRKHSFSSTDLRKRVAEAETKKEKL
jgi:glycerol-3-phosphate cytidylyltransferase